MLPIIVAAILIAICQVNYLNAFKSISIVKFSNSVNLKMKLDENNGYDAIGTLTRQGPVPFFIRIFKSDTYNAAVDKYMMKEKCSRLEAMANMDAYFQDPNGWASNKLRSRKTGVQNDYVNFNQSKSSLALTTVWTLVLVALVYRIIDVNI